MKNKKKIKAWAWKCEFGLCKWAQPDRFRLEREGKPSPEARAVRVQLVELAPKRKRKTKA